MIKRWTLPLLIFYSCMSVTTTIQAAANPPITQKQAPKQNTKSAAKREIKIEDSVDYLLDHLTPGQQSVLNNRIQKQRAATSNPFSLILYRPTYILPFYYTGSPYAKIYAGNTPDEQRVMNEEFKAQLSIMVPIIPHLFHNPNASIDIAYTQLNYWQFYTKSQYFRETNYEPEVFVEDYFHTNWLFRAGVDHQSNGRGGLLERSWNRAIGTLQFSAGNWFIGLNAWVLIFQGESSDLHNPDIAHFLGYENLLLAYQFHNTTFAVQLQNLESGLSRGSVCVTVSHPVLKHVLVYAQYFNGYGQSLIEYNHRTQSGGIGIAFNDWI